MATSTPAQSTVVGDGIAVHPLGHVATPARPEPTIADVKRAAAIGRLESAQAELCKAYDALALAGGDIARGFVADAIRQTDNALRAARP